MAGREDEGVGGVQEGPDRRRPESELEQRVRMLEARLGEVDELNEAVEEIRRTMSGTGELLRSLSRVRTDGDETGELPPAP